MNRGLGGVQRQIMVVLDVAPKSLSVRGLAAAGYGPSPAPAQQVGVRRATRRLRDTGLVFRGRGKTVFGQVTRTELASLRHERRGRPREPSSERVKSAS